MPYPLTDDEDNIGAAAVKLLAQNIQQMSEQQMSPGSPKPIQFSPKNGSKLGQSGQYGYSIMIGDMHIHIDSNHDSERREFGRNANDNLNDKHGSGG